MARKSDGHTIWDVAKIFGPGLLITIVAVIVAYQFVDPAPPRRITIATGSPGGAYHAYAERYREILARDSIELVLLETAGSVENIALLESGDADLAFVQGGTGGHAQTDELISLGSVYYEPLWLFHRHDLPLEHVNDLAGVRLSMGRPGSGTRALVEQMLADNGLTPDKLTLVELADDQLADAFEAGEVDVAMLVASPVSENVIRLFGTPGAVFLDFERAEAYARRYPFLSVVTMPEGAIDLQSNAPGHDIRLLAPTAAIVAHEGFHPALSDLVLGAADEVHTPGGLLEKPGEFPTPHHLDFPLSKESRRYFTSGPPFLRRTLPFWAATLVDRLKVMLLPLMVLIIPLMKLTPILYRWRMRSRVYRWYKQLRTIEADLRREVDAERRRAITDELERIETDVRQVSIPWSFADELYQLRVHIDYVRHQIER